MAVTFGLATEAGYKAGANCNAAMKVAGPIESLGYMAEAYVNVATNYNWCDKYATLSADVKYLLVDAATNIMAMYIINYDLSGFTSRIEAETMLDLLRDRTQQDIEILQKAALADFARGTP
jgi:hypothetical protein